MIVNEGTPLDLSIIIPAYNAEKKIGKAIRSIQHHKRLSWELILVENGSTDKTREVCLKYANGDNRICFTHSEKGVSKARNKGLLKARGKWVCFLDADDYFYNEALDLLAIIFNQKEVDLLLFGHNSNQNKDRCLSADIKIYEGESFDHFRSDMLRNPTYYMPVWGKVFSNQIIRQHDLKFDEDLVLAEDSDFTFRYSQFCNSIGCVQAILYHYSKDNSSTVRTYRKGIADNYIKALKKTRLYVINETNEIKQAFFVYILMHLLLILVHDTFSQDNPLPFLEKRREMKLLLKMPIFDEALQHITLKDCKSLRMLPILSFKCRCYTFAIWMIRVRIWHNSIVVNKNDDIVYV